MSLIEEHIMAASISVRCVCRHIVHVLGILVESSHIYFNFKHLATNQRKGDRDRGMFLVVVSCVATR